MLLDTIEELQLDSRLVCINRGSAVHYGFILYSDTRFITLRLYDSDGLYNGLRIFHVSSIEHVSWSGNAIVSRMKMIERNGVHLVTPAIKMQNFDEFLKSANQHYAYVGFYDDYCDKLYVGPVHQVDEDWVRMTDLGSPSTLDRVERLLNKSEYQSLGVDTMYQRNLMLLHQRELAQ